MKREGRLAAIRRLVGSSTARSQEDLLVALRREIVALGLPSFLAFVTFALIGIASGHLLGGPDPSHRTSLAVSCTTRHVGLALLIAGGLLL